jgi:hypothetical protein
MIAIDLSEEKFMFFVIDPYGKYPQQILFIFSL